MEIIKYLFSFFLTLCCVEILVVKCSEKIKSVNNKESDNDEEEYSVFEPTSEWKPLRKDQAIPRGLHVRMNLATGKREAKLLDPDEKNDDDIHDISTVPSENKEDDHFGGLTAKELKYYLKKIQGDDRIIAEDELEKVKKKFRSYEELKDELLSLQSDVKTDAEIMKELISNYMDLLDRKASPIADEFKEEFDQEELSILTDLEYLVHQIDNAKEFVKMGIREVVFHSLNSTSSKIRYEATKLLGSAVQSNSVAQVTALDQGTLPILLRTLAIDSSYQVKSGALFGLSCLIRRFPAAQEKFVERGGLNTLSKLFNSRTSDQIKLQMKIVSLINDLLLEKRDALITLADMRDKNVYDERSAYEMHEIVTKINYYEDIALEDRLREGGWCQVFRDMFSITALNLEINPEQDIATANGDEPARPEHDSIDKIASVISSLAPTCHGEFVDLLTIATNLLIKYNELAKIENDSDSIFAQLQNTITNLTEALSKYNLKDEL